MRVFRLWANAASSTQPIPEAHISNAATSFACSRPLCPVKFKPMKLLLCLLSPFVICHSVFASDPVRIYLANDDHTDYMWTADADTYGRVFVEMLDYHLKLTDETMGNPSPYQNRFNADGSLWLWEYERRKTPAEFARLVARIKSGHLSAPLNAAVSCYGAQPTEAVLRGMYYAGRPRTPPRPSISAGRRDGKPVLSARVGFAMGGSRGRVQLAGCLWLREQNE
jgi:hypothetical protein